MIKKIEIVTFENINYLMVDNEVFDWAVEDDQIKQIVSSIKFDPPMKDNIIGSIFKNFINYFSEFIGRPITLKELNEAILKGEI